MEVRGRQSVDGSGQTRGSHTARRCVSPSPEMRPGVQLPVGASPTSSKRPREAQTGCAGGEAGVAWAGDLSSRWEWGGQRGNSGPWLRPSSHRPTCSRGGPTVGPHLTFQELTSGRSHVHTPCSSHPHTSAPAHFQKTQIPTAPPHSTHTASSPHRLAPLPHPTPSSWLGLGTCRPDSTLTFVLLKHARQSLFV